MLDFFTMKYDRTTGKILFQQTIEPAKRENKEYDDRATFFNKEDKIVQCEHLVVKDGNFVSAVLRESKTIDLYWNLQLVDQSEMSYEYRHNQSLPYSQALQYTRLALNFDEIITESYSPNLDEIKASTISLNFEQRIRLEDRQPILQIN